jgi:hypothetical protein
MIRNPFIAQAALVVIGYALWHFGYTVHIPYATMAFGYLWRMVHERQEAASKISVPVAWRYRDDGDDDGWKFADACNAHRFASADFVEPLYRKDSEK